MLERKRLRKTYTAVPGEDGDIDEDIELGEGIIGAQESGVAEGDGVVAAAAAPVGRKLTVEEEVDHWDENAPDDWDAPPEGSNAEDAKKQRAD